MRTHREIFFAYNGPGPWTCYFCDGKVEWDAKPKSARALNIHHLDGDHDNNSPDNLSAAHHACHTAHHLEDRKGWKHSEETKKMMAAKRRAAWEAGDYEDSPVGKNKPAKPYPT